MIQQILLAITFVYGPLYLLTYLNIFKRNLVTILESFIPFKSKFLEYLGLLFFYFSLCYQSYYWLFKTIH